MELIKLPKGNCNNFGSYSETKTHLSDFKAKLDYEKNQLDQIYNNKNQWRIFQKHDMFAAEKSYVAEMCNTYNVSNAWLKCAEIVTKLNLLDHKNNVHFDNAAFPGSFIVATHHLAAMHEKPYTWFASSLYEQNAENKEPLEDSYNLYKNYRRQWLMSENNNGDVLLSRTQNAFKKLIGNKITLYTSDLGFSVTDYNNQETIHAGANLGQCLSGLITLAPGGHFIIKQYTFFEPFTISLIYLLSCYFNEFYICKPITSRPANSEIYLVGKKFTPTASFDNAIEAMMNRLDGNFNMNPLVDSIPKTFIQVIYKALHTIYQKQIETLAYNINNAKMNIYPNRDIKFLKKRDKIIDNWYKSVLLLPIDNQDRLNMHDKFKQFPSRKIRR